MFIISIKMVVSIYEDSVGWLIGVEHEEDWTSGAALRVTARELERLRTVAAEDLTDCRNKMLVMEGRIWWLTPLPGGIRSSLKNG